MTTKLLKPLPVQKDFFVCDITDIKPRGDIASMEHPVFSLSTNKDMETREYHYGENWLKVIPSEIGLATIFDRDVLIFCISQGVTALNAGEDINPIMRFTAYDLLTATNRNTSGGSSYKSLNNALDRLTGTKLITNIKNGGALIKKGFHLLNEYEIIRKDSSGRMTEIEVSLPKWIMDAIYSKHILKFNPNYFTLRSPVHRKLYELMRKHCGRQQHWRMKLSNLQQKMGVKGRLPDFKRIMIKSETANNTQNFMPDYNFSVEEGSSNPLITVQPKPEMLKKSKQNKQRSQTLNLKSQTIETARQYVFHGDVHAMIAEWKEWAQTLPDKVRDPNAHFIAFCKKKCAEHQKRLSANL